MLKKRFILVLISAFMMSGGYLYATVLTFYNVGPKAATMGGAFVGRADNTAAIFYNPAGLAFQKGLGFRIDVGYYNYSIEARSAEPQRTDRNSEAQLFSSFFVGFTYKERISIGIGAFTPYSLVTKWPSTWIGDPLCLNSELNVFIIRPALAIKIAEYLSIGAGLDIIRSDVRWDFHNIQSTIFSPDRNWVINELDASGDGIGFTVGMLFKPSEIFQIGGRYQQKVDMDLEGKNTYGFNIVDIYDGDNPEQISGVDAARPEFYALQEVIFSLPLPSEFVLGFMLAPAKRIRIQADVQKTGWGRFQKWEFVAANPEDSYFPQPPEGEGMNDDPPEGAREGIELNMKDTWSFKLGGEYLLKEELSVRIGYERHQSALDNINLTPVLPILPRNVVSFGVGYDGPARSIADQSLIGNLTFDAYVQYVMLEERTSSYPGHPLTLGGNYWVFGMGVGFYL